MKNTTASLQQRIHYIRGVRVMFDYDLAELYQVPTKRINEQVRRNLRRFPPDFMFHLKPYEVKLMRSQFATASKRNVRYLPFAFTEHGVAMLSSVLNSDRAIKVNIAIVRAFIKLRELMMNPRRLARKIAEVERKLSKHDHQFKKHRKYIHQIFAALQELMATPKNRIGFS